MIYRASKLIIALVCVPITYFIIVLLLGIANAHKPDVIAVHWLSIILDLAFLPYMLTRSYYPNQAEISQLPPDIFALMVGTVIICWLLGALAVGLGWQLIRPISRLKVALIATIVICAFGVSVLWRIIHAPPPLPDEVYIQVDITQQWGEFPIHHRGFSQGGEGQMTQRGYFEDAMRIMTDIRPTYIRIDHLYDYYNILSFDDNGNPVYDFSELDRIVDAVINIGAEPLMSLSYTPPALAQDTVYAPPTDLNAWESLVYETVNYYNIERGLNIRYWEVWNEPNLAHFWDGTIPDYLELYSATAQGLKRADPSALIGGPATLSNPSRLPGYYRFSEQNWFTALINHANKNDLPIDFVSWHLYSTSPDSYLENIELHQSWLRDLDPQPLMLMTEWNYSGGKSSTMDNRRSVAYLAHTLSVLSQSDLQQAFYFEPIDGGDDWINSWGLIRADSTPKPSFYAYKLFDRLDGVQLKAVSNHLNVGAMATQSDDDIMVLIWNNTPSTESVILDIDGLPDITASTNLYGVDTTYGNSFYDDGILETFIESIPSETNNPPLLIDIPAHGIRLLEIVTR